MAAEWDWPDPPDKLILTTKKVHEGHPVRYVTHHSDGEWQFLDGGDVSEDDAVVIQLKHIIAEHSEVRSLADLPIGCQAWREDEESHWLRGPEEGEDLKLGHHRDDA